MNDEPHLSRLFRHDPTQLLAPRSAWSKSFDDFIGVYSVSIVFSIDGRSDESYELIWDAPMCERAFWLSPNVYEIRALPDFEPATMVLICPDNTRCGFYSGGCLWVDEWAPSLCSQCPRRSRPVRLPTTVVWGSPAPD